MILADENIPLKLIDALRARDIDVTYINEGYKGLSDFDIIEVARDTSLIILSEDKDFGEWIFAHKVTGVSVVFLRYSFDELASIIAIVCDLIVAKTPDLIGKFTVITTRKIRSRNI